MTFFHLTPLLLPLLACSMATTYDSVHASEEGPAREAPVELGRVAWQRDHDAAFARARETHKPVLILFQEIPG